MPRPFFFAANWKMNLPSEGIDSFVKNLKMSSLPSVSVAIAAPYPFLLHLSQTAKSKGIHVAAQNASGETSGAYTGEVSCSMIREVGAEYVIIGHSERRQLFSETDEMINKKMQAALKAQLTPILCVGETLKQRDAEKTFDVVQTQLTKAFEGIKSHSFIIAYEPVWAIGTGKTATPQQAQEVHAYIRSLLVKQYSKEIAENILIIYGGSVKSDNASELMKQPDISGALVGGASLQSDEFSKIVASV